MPNVNFVFLPSGYLPDSFILSGIIEATDKSCFSNLSFGMIAEGIIPLAIKNKPSEKIYKYSAIINLGVLNPPPQNESFIDICQIGCLFKKEAKTILVRENGEERWKLK
jgi:hypothetical protein